jgi:hypothetical protein
VRHYAGPRLLVIDEVGYLSYSNRHADLLFELVSRHTSTTARSSPPTCPSPNGARSFQSNVQFDDLLLELASRARFEAVSEPAKGLKVCFSHLQLSLQLNSRSRSVSDGLLLHQPHQHFEKRIFAAVQQRHQVVPVEPGLL